MIKVTKVPARFREMIKHCYVAVPVGGSFSHPETNGFVNGFDDLRIIRDIYDLWQFCHAWAADLKKKPKYYSVHNAPKNVGEIPTWARLEIMTILNCKFAGNATFEWWERREDGHMEKTNWFDWIDSKNINQLQEVLINQLPITVLFDFPENNLNQAWALYQEIINRPGWRGPEQSLVEYEKTARPSVLVRHPDARPLFVPIEKIITGELTDFVPYTSPLSKV